MFNEYPYRNLTDVNLDFILKHIKYLETNLQDFVKLNTIKYANPIIWNITKQYETNTVVIDGNTGTAYLSVQPVPSGVALTNTDYWTVIFTLNLTTSNQNITLRDDGTNVIATFASDTGDWLLWNFYLYRVTLPIAVNTAYLEGFNLERYTVELFIKDYVTNILNLIGDLDDLNTTDKTTVVNAINSVLTVIGDLDDLNTNDKDNVVEAINELVSLKPYNFVNASFYSGANDTEILQNAVNNSEFVYVDRNMSITSIDIRKPLKLDLGGHTITANTSTNNAFNIYSSNVEIYNGRIDVTEDTPENIYNYGACIYTMNKPQFIDPPLMHNVNIHDLYLTSNGAIEVVYCGEITDCYLYNIDFDGSRSAHSTIQIAIDFEWMGDHNIMTYHPHRIKMFNINVHDFTPATAMPIRISGCFEMEFDNFTFYNCLYGFTFYAGDYGGDVAPIRYRSFVNSNMTVKNCIMNNVAVPVRFTGTDQHTSGLLSEIRLENLKCVGVTSPANNYQGIRGVYTKNLILKDCQLQKYYAGVSLTSSNDGAIIDNCIIEDMTTFGINLYGNDVKLTNNIVRRTNLAGGSTVSADTCSINVTGNKCVASNNNIAIDGNETALRSFRSTGSSYNVIFVGNLYGKNYTINATGTVVDNNLQVS